MNARRIFAALTAGAIAAIALLGCSRWGATSAAPAADAQVTGAVQQQPDQPTLTDTAQPTYVLVLGDSYAEGWAVAEADAMQRQLWPGAINRARTGIATWEMGEQFSYVRQQVAAGLVPEAVVLIVGGNDLDLISAVGECLFGDCPDPASLLPRLQEIRPNLVTVYREVDALINSEALIAARGGQVAPVLVGNYPKLLRPGPAISVGPLTITELNIERVNQTIGDLNAMIAQAVITAGGAVRLVDLSTSFDGHRFGDPEPFLAVNGHPNAAGYRAFLTEFSAALADR